MTLNTNTTVERIGANEIFCAHCGSTELRSKPTNTGTHIVTCEKCEFFWEEK
jgi:hypothetical protein